MCVLKCVLNVLCGQEKDNVNYSLTIYGCDMIVLFQQYEFNTNFKRIKAYINQNTY